MCRSPIWTDPTVALFHRPPNTQYVMIRTTTTMMMQDESTTEHDRLQSIIFAVGHANAPARLPRASVVVPDEWLQLHHCQNESSSFANIPAVQTVLSNQLRARWWNTSTEPINVGWSYDTLLSAACSLSDSTPYSPADDDKHHHHHHHHHHRIESNRVAARIKNRIIIIISSSIV